MANRYQDSYQSGSRRESQNWRDEDSLDEGRVQFDRSRESDQRSGSSGRYSGYGDFGRGEYGGGRAGWSGQDRSGQERYAQGNYGGSERDYGQSGWNEPYGEGQQYTSRGEYGGRGMNQDWGSQQRYGSQGQGSRDYGYSRGMGSQGYNSQGYGSQGMGDHRGKAPKGYQRSDERTKELLCERLRDDPAIDPTEVTITVQAGKITLEGTVDSRQTKNAIEEIADQFGVQDVQNNLRIQRAGQQSSEMQNRQGRGAGEENATSKQKHN